MRRLLLLVGLLTLALGACDKGPGAAPPNEHPPMAPPEEERGARLCQAYVDRVCACAAKDPSLVDTCELSKGQPSAVRMHLDVLGGAPLQTVNEKGEPAKEGPSGKRPPLNENERRLTESSLRKVIAACVELDAKLDPQKCPRPAP
jgi:hypothetical protein